MDINSLLISVVALILLILVSGFFSGSETALMALNKLKLKHEAKKGRKSALILEKILHRPDKLIGTILLGNNLVNVAASSIATYVAIELWGNEFGILYATIIMTLALLIFAEVTPKTFSAYHSEGTSYMVARPLKIIMFLFKPMVTLVTFFTNGILALMRVRRKPGELFTEDELKMMILLGGETGALGKKKFDMLQGVLDLREISVKDVMVPRTEIFAVDLEDSVEEIKTKIMKSPFSRIPVFRGDIEKMEGVLLVKDFLKVLASGDEPKLEEIISPTYFIPESKNIQGQLTDFQKKRVHMAVIIDEFGGIEGLVTMEDLLEEIVGEIWDESDRKINQIIRHGDGSITVEGKFTIRDLNKSFGVNLPEDEFNTVAGLILHKLGNIPDKNDKVEYMGFEFSAKDVVGQAVKKVAIRRLEPTSEERDV